MARPILALPPSPVTYLQLARLQAGFLLSLLGHDTQYIVPALFTPIPKNVPLGCLFQLHESFSSYESNRSDQDRAYEI